MYISTYWDYYVTQQISVILKRLFRRSCNRRKSKVLVFYYYIISFSNADQNNHEKCFTCKYTNPISFAMFSCRFFSGTPESSTSVINPSPCTLLFSLFFLTRLLTDRVVRVAWTPYTTCCINLSAGALFRGYGVN